MNLKGIEFDLSVALPLLVKDWLALEAKGIKLQDLSIQNSGVGTMAALAQYILKKANPAIPDDFVDGLTIDDCVKVASEIPKAEAAINRPT